MRKTKTLLTMGLCAAIGLFTPMLTPLFAEEKSEVKIPDTVESIWKEIHKYHMELGETVKNKKLADVHKSAFAIRDLAKALVPKADADKKDRVKGNVNNLEKLASDLDESGDANDQAKTEANLKKLDGMLKALEAQFEKK